MQSEYSYDPWGRQRDPVTLAPCAPGEEPELMSGRGYTGHEHLPEYGLIHMNARLYDPQTGRFLSPDPYVQDPANTQSYNRYAYALNNPLRYIDPSGELVYIYDYDRNCYMDEYGNRVDNSVVHLAMFQNGYFRGPTSIYGGRAYWGTPSYVIGGSGGAAPGYTWKNVYTSINEAEASLEVWEDGTPIAADVTTTGVLFKYQVPTTELFLGMADEGIGTMGLSIEGLNLGWEHLSAPSRQNLAYHIQQTLRDTGIRTTAKTIKIGIPNALKVLGRTTSVLSSVVSWYEYSQNPTTANLLRSITNTSLALLRINPIVNIGISVLDLTGASDWVYRQMGIVIDRQFY